MKGQAHCRAGENSARNYLFLMLPGPGHHMKYDQVTTYWSRLATETSVELLFVIRIMSFIHKSQYTTNIGNIISQMLQVASVASLKKIQMANW